MSSYNDMLTFLSPEEEELLLRGATEELRAMMGPQEIIAEPPNSSPSEALATLLAQSRGAAPEDTFVARGDTTVRGDLPEETSRGSFSRAAEGSSDRATLNRTPGGNAALDAYKQAGYSDAEALAFAIDAISEATRKSMAAENISRDTLSETTRSNKATEGLKGRELDDNKQYREDSLEHEERKLAATVDEAGRDRQQQTLLQELKGAQSIEELFAKAKILTEQNAAAARGPLDKLLARVDAGEPLYQPKARPSASGLLDRLLGAENVRFNIPDSEANILLESLGSENAAFIQPIIKALEQNPGADVSDIIRALFRRGNDRPS